MLCFKRSAVLAARKIETGALNHLTPQAVGLLDHIPAGGQVTALPWRTASIEAASQPSTT